MRGALGEQIKNLVLIGVNINARRHALDSGNSFKFGDLYGRKASKPRKKEGWDGDAGDCIAVRIDTVRIASNLVICTVGRLRNQGKRKVGTVTPETV